MKQISNCQHLTGERWASSSIGLMSICGVNAKQCFLTFKCLCISKAIPSRSTDVRRTLCCCQIRNSRRNTSADVNPASDQKQSGDVASKDGRIILTLKLWTLSTIRGICRLPPDYGGYRVFSFAGATIEQKAGFFGKCRPFFNSPLRGHILCALTSTVSRDRLPCTRGDVRSTKPMPSSIPPHARRVGST